MIGIALVVPLLIAGLVYAGREAVRRRQSVGPRGLAPFLGGLAGAAGLAAVLFGWAGMSGSILIVTALSIGSLTVFVATRDREVQETGWASWSAASDLPVDGTGPVRPPSRTGGVALALGRVEARELSRSPWFGVGFGFSVLIFVLFGFVWAGEDNGEWAAQLQLSSWFAYPMVGMVVLAMHRAVTRAARDGADEVFDVCPTDPATRTVGFLAVAVLPVAFLSALLVALAVSASARSSLNGPIGVRGVAEVASGALLGAGGVALGVALGRWIRFGLAPVMAVILVGIVGIQLNLYGGSWNPLSPLSTAPAVHDMSPIFTERPSVWHLAWIVALTTVVAIIALVRHRRDRLVMLGAVGSVFVLVISGISATRPMPSSAADRIATLVEHPERSQDCALAGDVEVCVYPLYQSLLDPVSDRIAPIAARLPVGTGPLTLRQSFDGSLDELPPEVRRRLTATDLARPANQLPLDFDAGAIDRSARDLAFAAVGLPLEPDEQRLPTIVAGQARRVVALWLVTRGLDPQEALEASSSPAPGAADAFDRGSLEVDECGGAPTVVWSAQDLAAARAAMALPEPDVARAVHDNWSRWTNAATSTDELLASLGLAPVGPFDAVVARPGSTC